PDRPSTVSGADRRPGRGLPGGRDQGPPGEGGRGVCCRGGQGALPQRAVQGPRPRLYQGDAQGDAGLVRPLAEAGRGNEVPVNVVEPGGVTITSNFHKGGNIRRVWHVKKG